MVETISERRAALAEREASIARGERLESAFEQRGFRSNPERFRSSERRESLDSSRDRLDVEDARLDSLASSILGRRMGGVRGGLDAVQRRARDSGSPLAVRRAFLSSEQREKELREQIASVKESGRAKREAFEARREKAISEGRPFQSARISVQIGRQTKRKVEQLSRQLGLERNVQRSLRGGSKDLRVISNVGKEEFRRRQDVKRKFDARNPLPNTDRFRRKERLDFIREREASPEERVVGVTDVNRLAARAGSAGELVRDLQRRDARGEVFSSQRLTNQRRRPEGVPASFEPVSQLNNGVPASFERPEVLERRRRLSSQSARDRVVGTSERLALARRNFEEGNVLRGGLDAQLVIPTSVFETGFELTKGIYGAARDFATDNRVRTAVAEGVGTFVRNPVATSGVLFSSLQSGLTRAGTNLRRDPTDFVARASGDVAASLVGGRILDPVARAGLRASRGLASDVNRGLRAADDRLETALRGDGLVFGGDPLSNIGRNLGRRGKKRGTAGRKPISKAEKRKRSFQLSSDPRMSATDEGFLVRTRGKGLKEQFVKERKILLDPVTREIKKIDDVGFRSDIPSLKRQGTPSKKQRRAGSQALAGVRGLGKAADDDFVIISQQSRGRLQKLNNKRKNNFNNEIVNVAPNSNQQSILLQKPELKLKNFMKKKTTQKRVPVNKPEFQDSSGFLSRIFGRRQKQRFIVEDDFDFIPESTKKATGGFRVGQRERLLSRLRVKKERLDVSRLSDAQKKIDVASLRRVAPVSRVASVSALGFALGSSNSVSLSNILGSRSDSASLLGSASSLDSAQALDSDSGLRTKSLFSFGGGLGFSSFGFGSGGGSPPPSAPTRPVRPIPPFFPRVPRRPKTPPLVPEKPIIPKPDLDPSNDRVEEGFFTEVRRGGRFVRVGAAARSRADALRRGAQIASESAVMSFRAVPSGTSVRTDSPKLKKGFVDRFRKKPNGVFVEKRKDAINSAGELRDITRKGRARRGGFF